MKSRAEGLWNKESKNDVLRANYKSIVFLGLPNLNADWLIIKWQMYENFDSLKLFPYELSLCFIHYVSKNDSFP